MSVTTRPLSTWDMLPDSEKRALCISLLEDFGVTHISETIKGELRHRCVLPLQGHSDRNSITASLNYRDLVFNCLSGDTLVKVKDRGDVPISVLAEDGSAILLDGRGHWVEAPVKAYGVDALRRVTLTRNKMTKVVYATGSHRWYHRKYDGTTLLETTTDELKPGQRIPSVGAHPVLARTRKYERTHWVVRSVEETDRVETVYCAEVSTTHSFVLADNLLTGNCWVCKNAGSVFWFVSVMRGISVDASMAVVSEITGVTEIPELPTLQLMIDQIMHGAKTPKMPMPTFNEGFLTQWIRPVFHPLLTLPTADGGRAIREETLAKYRVGYCDHDDVWKYYQRAIFPMWWDGKLVGWQARRLNPFEDPITAKYLNSPDLPRDRMLYGMPTGSVCVVMESLMSKLRHDHHLPTVATLGAQLTDDQLRALHRYSKVIWFPDNDEGGVTGLRGTRHNPGVLDKLKPHTDVWVVRNDYLASVSPVVGADPGDMGDDLVEELVNNAVPHELWRPPTVVESRPLTKGMAA